MKTKNINMTKKEKIENFLNEEYVLLHINTKSENLTIPLHLRQGNTVVLKISRFFRGEMELTDENVIANLLFSGSYFTCIIPYEAIWGITNSKGENIFWPESTPKEVLEDIFAEIEPEIPVRDNSEKQPVRPSSGLYCIDSKREINKRTKKKTAKENKQSNSNVGEKSGLRLVK